MHDGKWKRDTELRNESHTQKSLFLYDKYRIVKQASGK